MSDVSVQKQKIGTLLQKKFNPQAIVLVGSRADGTATQESDWDVFLFCDERRAGVELREDNLLIDVNFSTWPKADSYFDTGFGPVQPIQVLFDDSKGRLENLLTNTEAAYKKGPLELQAEIAALNLRSFERYIEKLRKYENDEVMQFYYKGMFLNKFLTVWFEQQNIWAPSPAKALVILRDIQPRLFDLLQKLTECSGAEVSEVVIELTQESSS